MAGSDEDSRNLRRTTSSTTVPAKQHIPEIPVCDENELQCLDGTCVKATDLCPEQAMMSQETILIMIGVGMAVVLFLIVLYCLQQRRGNSEDLQPVSTMEDVENPELLIPPPSYEEALNVSLYPPTPQTQRANRIPSAEEPITPPPNYDTALHILAQSHDSVFTSNGKNRVTSPLLRQCLSVEHITGSRRQTNISNNSTKTSGACAQPDAATTASQA